MTYAQVIGKPRVGNVCVRCETTFRQWSVYHAHVTAGVRCSRRIVPLKTSSRTTAQIVNDMEQTKLKGWIIE